METYKDLKVWQRNQDCILKCAKLLDALPKTSPCQSIYTQLFRSISSVGANIAEGYGSYEGKEYSRYLKIAFRSAIESDHWLTTLGKITANCVENIAEIAETNIETIKMLKGLIRSIEAKRADINPTPYALSPEVKTPSSSG